MFTMIIVRLVGIMNDDDTGDDQLLVRMEMRMRRVRGRKQSQT